MGTGSTCRYSRGLLGSDRQLAVAEPRLRSAVIGSPGSGEGTAGRCTALPTPPTGVPPYVILAAGRGEMGAGIRLPAPPTGPANPGPTPGTRLAVRSRHPAPGAAYHGPSGHA